VTHVLHLPPLELSFTTLLRRHGVSETTRCSLFRFTQTSATGTSTSTGVQSYLEYCGNSPANWGLLWLGGGGAGVWGLGAHCGMRPGAREMCNSCLYWAALLKTPLVSREGKNTGAGLAQSQSSPPPCRAGFGKGSHRKLGALLLSALSWL